MDLPSLLALITACAPTVDAGAAQALIAVESSVNPHAIGIVGAQLERQPRHRAEAVATARSLRASGHNFSVGLAQINVRNFHAVGLTAETAFEPCANLQAMQRILSECMVRARRSNMAEQDSLRRALSCYYSGNFHTGFAHGYVQRTAHAAARAIHASKHQEVR
ncbi:MAG: lytic transglycosylase domain-containing protein [Burkholderiaceae bacterium]|nr:lytic transglycosylase domain-containing protein [Burkholderiaceae bacterium]